MKVNLAILKKANLIERYSTNPKFSFPEMIQIQVINLKVKFTLEQATKAQKGSRGISVLFL
jgi:hypothetical protein